MQSPIEKIKSLLALASDPTTTEHERQLAFARAKTLIDRHAVKEQDLNPTEPLEILSVPFAPSGLYKVSVDLQIKLPWILNPIAEYFGCFAMLKAFIPCFVGYKHNIEVCQYAANVLLKQGVDDFKKAFRNRVGNELLLTFESKFWAGFIGAMQERFSRKEEPQSQELTIYNPIQRYKESLRTLNWFCRYDPAAEGFRSGRDAQLYKPLETSMKGNQLR